MEFITQAHRIFLEGADGKLLAEVTFPETENGVYCIDHTFVDDALRGQGVAAQLVERACSEIRRQGGIATASCSYAQRYLEKQKDS